MKEQVLYFINELLVLFLKHRRLSYSRHAVNDRDLSTQPVNYRMHMNIRRMVGERKHHHKRSKKLGKVSNGVTFTPISMLQTEPQF
jgi:sodium/hydrogen exchanger-like protein 3